MGGSQSPLKIQSADIVGIGCRGEESDHLEELLNEESSIIFIFEAVS